MSAYFVPVLFYCCLNFAAVQIAKKRFGEVLPLTIMAAVLWIYFSQFLFQSFRPGLMILWAAAVFGAGCLVRRLILKRETDAFVSPGLWGFFVVCAAVTILDFHRELMDFDEFWHWGMMIKESLRLDRFYCEDASRMVIHKDYPPFLSILELIWVRTAGRYAEDLATIPVHVFLLSILVLPLTEAVCIASVQSTGENSGRSRTDGKKVRTWFGNVVRASVLLLLTLLLINAFDYAHIFLTLLADIPLAAVFGFGLLQVVSGSAYQKGFGTLLFFMTGIFLVMTKQVGIALLLVVWLYYLTAGVSAISGGSAHTPERSAGMACGRETKILRLLGSGGLFLFIPLAVLKSWSAYVKALGVTDIRSAAGGSGQFDLEKISISGYLDAVFGRAPELQQETFRELVKAVFFRPVAEMRFLPLTLASSLLLLLVLLIVLHCCFPSEFSKKDAAAAGVTFFTGTAGYAFMLSVLFLFCFTPDEMQELRGYERYTDAYVLGEYLMLCLTAVGLSCRKAVRAGFPAGADQRKTLVQASFFPCLLAADIVLLTGLTGLKYLAPQALRTSGYRNYRTVADLLLAKTTPDSKITVVYDCSEGTYGYWYGSLQSVIYYYMNDRDVLWGQDLFPIDYSKEDQRIKAETQLENSDYLLVLNTNQDFSEFFSQYNDGKYPKRAGVYQVGKDVGGISLTLQ